MVDVRSPTRRRPVAHAHASARAWSRVVLVVVCALLAVALTVGCAAIDSVGDSSSERGSGDGAAELPVITVPDADGAGTGTDAAAENGSTGDGDGSFWSSLVWVLVAGLIVVAVVVIAGVIVLIVRSGREQTPAVPAELPRTRPGGARGGVDDVAARARWVSRHTDEVMDAPDARELQRRWHDLRDHMIDLEGRIAVVSQTSGDGHVGEEIRRLHRDVEALRHSIGAYVSLTIHPDRTSDPDDYVRKLERAMDAVASHKGQVEQSARRAAAENR